MSTPVYNGFTDLAGQQRGTLLIERLASRHPVRWHVRCLNDGCGLRTVIDHARLQNGAVTDCTNLQCKRPASAPRAAFAATGFATPAIRSRDSDSARQFQRERQTARVTWREPTADTFANADPDALRHYLDSREDQ